MPEQEQTLRRPEELANALGVKTVTIQQYCREGRIACVRVGRLYRIRPETFDRILVEGIPPRSRA